MEPIKQGWRLPSWWWGLILLPLLVFGTTNYILTQWGQASFELAQPMVADGHAEAAGRLRSEATYLLFCGLAAAGLFYSALIISSLCRKTRLRLLIGWGVSMALGIAIVLQFGLDQGDAYLERDFACASFDRLGTNYEQQAGRQVQLRQLPPPATLAKGNPPPRMGSDRLVCAGLDLKARPYLDVPPARYAQDSYRTLRLMYVSSALLLFLAMPSFVWAAIGCLALPQTERVKERHAAWCRQAARLNRLLYITAGFLVAGLLFTSARMMWPAYSLHPADLAPFGAHVSSFVLFMGVSNSLLIASYYIPVAAYLAWLEPRLRPATGEGSPGHDTFAAFKTAATILSPALVALVGELLKFTG